MSAPVLIAISGGSGSGGDGGSGGGTGPLTFLQPADGASVTSPVAVTIQHPDSHVELWSGPALLFPYLFDHPAHADVTLGLGARNLTARAYPASGAWPATRPPGFAPSARSALPSPGTPSPG